MAETKRKISYCITCKGRLEHLKQTLPENLRNAASYGNVEFVVLNYDSPDELENWISKNFKKEIAEGKIRYAQIRNKPHFHMAHAKNLAHRLATGDILCNLDADNVVAPEYTSWLNDRFNENSNIIVRAFWDNVVKRFLTSGSLFQSGLGGRIAITRDHFMQLRGYDETIAGWGGEDENLQRRALEAGLTLVSVPNRLRGTFIDHDDASRTKHMAPEVKEASDKTLAGRHSFIDGIKRKGKKWFGKKPPLTPANPDGNFGQGTVRINFEDSDTQIGNSAIQEDLPEPPESTADPTRFVKQVGSSTGRPRSKT